MRINGYFFIILFAPYLAETNIDYDGKYEYYWKLYSTAIEDVVRGSKLLRKVDVSVSSLLKAADPSVEIIAKSINDEIEPNSYRNQLMKRFHNDSTERRTTVKNRMRDLLPHLSASAAADNFFDVRLAIDELDTMLWQATFEDRDFRLWAIPIYEQACKNIDSSIILDSLEGMFMHGCPIPTVSSHEQHAAIINALIRAESGTEKVSEFMPDDYTNAVLDLRASLHVFSHNETQFVVQELDNARGLSRSALAKLLTRLNNIPRKRKVCRLASGFYAEGNKRATLYAVIFQLEFELLRLIWHVPPCAWRLNKDENQETLRKEYVTSLETRIENLLNHSWKWAHEALKLDWPSLMLDQAMDVLGSEIYPGGTIGNYNYDRAARIIKRELDIRGPQSMEHQVLVTGLMVNELNYWAYSETGYETDYQMRRDDDRGILVHVVRFDTVTSDRNSYEGTRIFNERRDQITQFMRDFHKPGNGPDAMKFLTELQQAHALIGPSSFHHAIVIQRDGFSKDQYEIVVGEGVTKISGSEKLSYWMKEEEYTPRGFLRRDYTTRIYVLS